MSEFRICFLGTPEFAAEPLDQLLQDSRFQIVGVVTQPDRPAGRKQEITASAVKKFCLGHGLAVISPNSVNQPDVLEQIRSWNADAAVVVAFGQLLTGDFMGLFPHGAVNIHYSLLPRWRGAAPVQRCLEAGDLETGVALQKIVLKLDAGDLIGVRKIALQPDTNARVVFDQLAPLASELLKNDFVSYLRGEVMTVPQDHSAATYAKKIEKSEAAIRWTRSAEQIHNQIRAFVLGPGSFFTFKGKRIKILRSEVAESGGGAAAGIVRSVYPLEVQTGAGILRLLSVQPESRNAMDAKTFASHLAMQPRDIFE